MVDESGPLEPRGDRAPGHRDTAISFHELPMESRAKVAPGSGKHSAKTHFPMEPNCDICLKTQIARASCRRRAGTVVPRADIFGDLITEDHKILTEESESRKQSSIEPWWCKIWQHSSNNPTHVKEKLPSRPRRA